MNTYKQTSEQLKEEKRINERSHRNLESKLGLMTNDLENHRREKSNLHDEIKRLSFRIEDLERERNLALEESDGLRKMHSEKLSDAVKE